MSIKHKKDAFTRAYLIWIRGHINTMSMAIWIDLTEMQQNFRLDLPEIDPDDAATAEAQAQAKADMRKSKRNADRLREIKDRQRHGEDGGAGASANAPSEPNKSSTPFDVDKHTLATTTGPHRYLTFHRVQEDTEAQGVDALFDGQNDLEATLKLAALGETSEAVADDSDEEYGDD
ncbi:unnamed protein product [Clonostachys rosea]|uniref:Uncharacterized protein n=1 Tax=Bionectria ochroleuca TaxID=29856 RepID=A0ABY6UCU6_BIOOC|nr:unnamed protein product [Clonostachys rosea]